MTDTRTNTEDIIGIIRGIEAGSGYVVVELDTGERVQCRGVKRLHRTLGFYTVPYGRRAKIRYTRGTDRMPLLVEVLKD